MALKLIFDPIDTTLPTHLQRVTLMSLVGRKGEVAYKAVKERLKLVLPDIRTATQAELDAMIALLSEYEDLEDKWQRKRRKSRKNLSKP